MDDDRRALMAAPHAYAEHEHRELLAQLARIHEAGVAAREETAAAVRRHLDATLRWLERDLLAHLAWEEVALYPDADRVAGTPWATLGLRREHGQIRTLTHGLRELRDGLPAGELTGAERGELGARLHGLAGVIRAHAEREEDQILPLVADGIAPAVPA